MSELMNTSEYRSWLGQLDAQKGKMQEAAELILVSPFITRAGIAPLINTLRKRNRKLKLTIVTSLRWDLIAGHYLDLEQLERLLEMNKTFRQEGLDKHVTIYNHPKLHAKICLARNRNSQLWRAVVGSANLTQSDAFEMSVSLTGKQASQVKDRVDNELFPHSEICTIEELQKTRKLIEEYRKFRALREKVGFTVIETMPDKSKTTRTERLIHRDSFGGEHVYYDNLKLLLQNDFNREKQWSRAQELVQNASTREKSQTPARRLFFMHTLGLIDIDPVTLNVKRTDLGKKVAKNNRIPDGFYQAFFKTIPHASEIAAQIHEHFRGKHQRNRVFDYEGFFADIRKKKLISDDCPEKRILRWMTALQLLKTRRSRRSEFMVTANWPAIVKSLIEKDVKRIREQRSAINRTGGPVQPGSALRVPRPGRKSTRNGRPLDSVFSVRPILPAIHSN